MADTDELHTKKKLAGALKIVAIAVATLIAVPVFFAILSAALNGGYIFVGVIAAVFFIPSVRSFVLKLFERPSQISNTNAQNLVSDELAAQLSELENERLNLVTVVKETRLIALGVCICAWVVMSRLSDDGIFGAACGAVSYAATMSLLTASKRRRFRSNFKRQIIENIVKKHGLSYDKDRGLELYDFFVIYDCRVDEWHREDLVEGEIEGVRIKFSDFYAAKKIKNKNNTETVVQFKGVLFKADFNKNLSSITQISHINSKNLKIYGEKANMDDVRGARYALSPALMEKFTELCFRLGAPVNAVFKDNQILIAMETGLDSFEPNINKTLMSNETIAFYESEIASFIQIVKELNLNRKIW